MDMMRSSSRRQLAYVLNHFRAVFSACALPRNLNRWLVFVILSIRLRVLIQVLTGVEMAMLEAVHLNKTYWGTVDVPVLHDVSFSLNKGEMAAIMGASGSGKSTLLHILAGVDAADSGEVMIQGTAISSLTRDERTVFRRRNIGLIYQFFNLIPSLPVEKNIQLPLLLDACKPEPHFFQEILHCLSIDQLTQRYPHQLSGGEQQRVAIARALLIRPAIILADEPTGNLDRKNTEEVLGLFQKIHQQYGSTILLVTHDQDVALAFPRILHMRDGQIGEMA